LSFALNEKNQEMMTSLLICHLLQLKKNAKNDNELRGSSLSSTTEEKQQKTMISIDPSSSLSFAPQEKNQEMTMNLLACHSLLHLRKKSRDNSEPFSSSSSSTFEEKNEEMTTSQEACCHFLQLKQNNQGC